MHVHRQISKLVPHASGSPLSPAEKQTENRKNGGRSPGGGNINILGLRACWRICLLSLRLTSPHEPKYKGPTQHACALCTASRNGVEITRTDYSRRLFHSDETGSRSPPCSQGQEPPHLVHGHKGPPNPAFGIHTRSRAAKTAVRNRRTDSSTQTTAAPAPAATATAF